ncbi:gephyrin-like molybdotransferase Glp [Acetobacterium bakii]|uniref:Molybdopterin molybdenumtransferase n=1 Tax=Acetobacterium bakii TaxID=52689 RepID=A0A0L6U4D6_9FIRM|nr:gephyrin-like molybdotransferase Glp [Acetobacterium bakii]KNZ43369.1 molybdopterin biosynthesis MoeA protein [Acetobacterium bakii]
MLKGIELTQAIDILLENVQQVETTEIKGILEALSRIAAQDVVAPLDNPPFDRSPVDGYALIAEDSTGASLEKPVKLKVVGKLFAGDYSDIRLKSNQAIRIMTGAMIPQGANCVIRQESTNYGEDIVEIYEPLKTFQNYCYTGEDFKRGNRLISKGEKLNFVHLALLASMGYTTINVYTQPKVALLVTGDELAIPGSDLGPGKIYNSNLFLIAARLKELSIMPVYLQQSGDDVDIVIQKLKQAVSVADLVITTGGVSVGEKDIFHQVLPKMGADQKFWKVKLKPGTPAIFSTYKNIPILSLSGNPFAALATFELLARPVLGKMARDASLLTTTTTATMETDFSKRSKGKRFVRAVYQNGKVKLPESGHASGMVASMKDCNCLVEIEAGNNGTKKGEMVKVIVL